MVRRLDQGPFGLNSVAEVRQPRLPRNIWRVTEFEVGRRFEWATSSPGITVRGDHWIPPIGADRCELSLALTESGPLSMIVRPVYGSLNRRYLRLEADSMRRHCEATLT